MLKKSSGSLSSAMLLTFLSAVLVVIFTIARADAGASFQMNGDAAKGKTVFTQTCMTCHGEKGDGKGIASAALNPKPRNFTDKALMATITDEQIYKIVNDGGASVGKSALMASFKSSLTDQQIRDVAAYVRSFAK